MSLNRREFIRKTSVAAAAFGVPMVISRQALAVGNEIRVAQIGCGVRSETHLSTYLRTKGVRVVAVCDPDSTRMASAAKSVAAISGKTPDQVADVRKLMERKDFDVASIATMQYWHALPTVWACETGRDVYVEKPLSHFIWEGRQMVNAARKHKRLVQCGIQSRSEKKTQQSIDYVKSGKLGKILYIVCFANKMRGSVGKRKTPLPIPETLDYDVWCGPAKKEPIYRNRIQYDCSFTWNMGDGESCNQGVHEIDVARRVLGETGTPRRVMSLGGRFAFNDAGEVPNTQITYYDFPSAPVLYEVHNMSVGKGTGVAPTYRDFGVDACVQCEGGYVMMRAGAVFDAKGKKIEQFAGDEDHIRNFIQAVRSGKREDLRCDILEGHISTSVCHVGNISYRVGKKASVAEVRRQIGDLPVFQKMFDDYAAHLKAHAIDPDETTLGPWLAYDGKSERFQDAPPQANLLVKGTYREPFVMPEVS
jgi:predicted dehydrogenase